MYVNEFVLGVLATVFVEMAIIIATYIVILVMAESNTHNTNKHEGGH